MDGSLAGLPGHGPGTVLQRFLFDRPLDRRALYWRDAQAEAGGIPVAGIAECGALHIERGATVRFDTYFNVFFEAPWRRWTPLDSLRLRLSLSGTALLRIWRIALDAKTLIAEEVAGPGTCSVTIPNPTLNFRQHGVLFAELTALEDDLLVRDGVWVTDDQPPAEIGLAVVLCTFNREDEVGRVLRSLAEDDGAMRRVGRVFVVNQGGPGLHVHPDVAEAALLLDGKLTILEQENFGGAGGFGRGMLAALADPATSHIVLLDDDLDLEPDSLLRMAAFFSFCTRPVVLGGHMLDLMRPTVLYEAGAVINERHWEFWAQHHGADLTDPAALAALSQPYAVHYNGWWCCGFPLSILREHGMPMPCFIRGDDVEFGLRLHQRGVPNVPMPGIAVWHAPFYLKLGGWHLYYEVRNLLVAASQHLPFDRPGVLRRIGRQVVQHLLTHRYYATALILRGIRDFLAGPDVMQAPPQARHAGLFTLLQRYPVEWRQRELVAHEQPLRPIPNSRLYCFFLTGWLLLRNTILPTSDAPRRHMKGAELHWLTMRSAGPVVVETLWDRDLLALRHDRTRYRPLLREATSLLWRLYRDGPAAGARWCAAMPHLTSVPFWQRYLGVTAQEPRAAVSASADETEAAWLDRP
jgi:galactofuranosylgalactofuranosylrhamnosyl-N-acetylglucosaminyl-diphospho-decaprenol beta-1,5/1,6-galactofuranosyltransferase